MRSIALSKDEKKRSFHFFDKENKIKPTPNIVKVIGQGSGNPRGLGLFKTIKVESTIRRKPETMKHNFDIFNMETSFSRAKIDV